MGNPQSQSATVNTMHLQKALQDRAASHVLCESKEDLDVTEEADTNIRLCRMICEKQQPGTVDSAEPEHEVSTDSTTCVFPPIHEGVFLFGLRLVYKSTSIRRNTIIRAFRRSWRRLWQWIVGSCSERAASPGHGGSAEENSPESTPRNASAGEGLAEVGLRSPEATAAPDECRITSERGHVAVAGTWLGIPKGQCFCLLGPNGAGKTTTLRCLTGVRRTLSWSFCLVRWSFSLTNDPSALQHL